VDETVLLPSSIEPQEIVYRDRNQTIQRVIARFDGFSKEYFVCDHAQRTALLAINNSGVLLARQYRLLINGLSYEIPGGRIEENETPAAAAVRECLEETGVLCTGLKPLIDYLPSMDILKNHTHIFYSEKVQEIENNMSGSRTWMPIERCIDMLFDRQIVDSMTIIALLAYTTKLNRAD